MEPEKKVGPSDFQAEVERLHAAGKLPALHELLGAVASTRKEYAPKILEARKLPAESDDQQKPPAEPGQTNWVDAFKNSIKN